MINKCLNCKHDWIQRSDMKTKPKTCPKCKSYYWNDEEHWKDKTHRIEKEV